MGNVSFKPTWENFPPWLVKRERKAIYEAIKIQGFTTLMEAIYETFKLQGHKTPMAKVCAEGHSGFLVP